MRAEAAVDNITLMHSILKHFEKPFESHGSIHICIDIMVYNYIYISTIKRKYKFLTRGESI